MLDPLMDGVISSALKTRENHKKTSVIRHNIRVRKKQCRRHTLLDCFYDQLRELDKVDFGIMVDVELLKYIFHPTFGHRHSKLLACLLKFTSLDVAVLVGVHQLKRPLQVELLSRPLLQQVPAVRLPLELPGPPL